MNDKPMSDLTVDQVMTLAVQHFQAGQLSQAASLCHQILQVMPHNSDALHGLSVIAAQSRQYDEALLHIEQAIAHNARNANLYNSLGNIHWYRKELPPAIKAYQYALQLEPQYTDAWNGLGNVYHDQGHYEEALRCYQRAIQLNPNYPQAFNGIGNVHKELQHLDEAIRYYRKALTLHPNFVEALNNLGGVYCDQEKFDEATQYCQRALELRPTYAKAHNNFGNILRRNYRYGEALNYYQKALALDANLAEAFHNLANIYRDMGNAEQALVLYRQALDIKLSLPIYSNFLTTLHYSNDYSAEAIFREYTHFNQQIAEPLAPLIKPHHNKKQVNRRLRIGYLSADFREHSVAYFIESALANHDHQAFEIFCYFDHDTSDAVTKRMRKYADQWIVCDKLDDEELSKRIRKDRIDLFIDLMGHFSRKNRLPVFARKPAPVQVTFLGYPATSGVKAIDYRIVDEHTDPIGMSDSLSLETLIRLPRSYFCYHPLDNSPIPDAPPVMTNGYVTFGSFNYCAKLSVDILKIWAELLQRLPQARLLIKSNTYNLLNDVTIRQIMIERFAALGLPVERVTLLPYIADTTAHLKAYQQIDIALDTYPYNGATTTCEALWMGTPVITLVGKTHPGRMGLSILSALGMSEWVAHTPEEYLQKSIALAENPEKLQYLRQHLRPQVKKSSLMNGIEFTRALETAYRHMWKNWCES